MPFGTTRIEDYDPDRRARLDPRQVAEINGYRAAWGIPAVTTTGVHDPAGAVHEAERGNRRSRAATIVQVSGLVLKLWGVITANEALKQLGKAVNEVAKMIAKEAAEILAALPEDIAVAYAEEFAHAVVAGHRIAQDRALLLRWEDAHAPAESAAIAFANDMLAKQNAGGTLTPAEVARLQDETALRSRTDTIPPNMRLAKFLPITRAPAVRSIMPGAAERSRQDTLALWLRKTTHLPLVAQMMRRPLTPEEQAILSFQMAPFRARNVLHPAAVRVLLERPAWQARVAAAKAAHSQAKVAAALDLARVTQQNAVAPSPAPPQLVASVPSPGAILAQQQANALPLPMPDPPTLPQRPPTPEPAPLPVVQIPGGTEPPPTPSVAPAPEPETVTGLVPTPPPGG